MNFMLNYRDTRFFSTLDLRSGYYHIGLSEDAKPKTAFVVAGMGKYQFNRVSLRIGPSTSLFPDIDQ